MQQRKLKLPIPVTIITGALGVGKTTALCQLVQQKPPDQVWCIIVNEFGAVGIDAAVIEGSAVGAAAGTVTVKQLAGGCMCCVLAGPLSAAIAQIIRQAKPDRVIIEPSGLGHPGGLVDILQGPHLCTSLQLQAIICLVDLTAFQDLPQLMANSTAADQISIADVLVGSKADAAPAGAAEDFQRWATEDMFPCKSQVLVIQQGQLPVFLLDSPRSAAADTLAFRPRSSGRQQHQAAAAAAVAAAAVAAAAHAVKNQATEQEHAIQEQQEVQQQQQQQAPDQAPPAAGVSGCGAAALPGQPYRLPGASRPGQQLSSCGWQFHEDDVFDQARLLQLLPRISPAAARLKGVFKIGPKQWVIPVAVHRQMQREGDELPNQPMPLSSASSSCCNNTTEKMPQSSFVLQPLCHRGPSIVEVIMDATATNLHLESLCQELQTFHVQSSRPPGQEAQQLPPTNSSWQEALEDAFITCLRK